MVEDFYLGAFDLQCGLPTRGLRLRYEVHGRLDAARSNAILFPTWFAGRHPANRWIIGQGRALDTERFCVVVVNALGNGESASPSNDPQLLVDGKPAAISLYDNVRAQRQLARHLGIERFEAIVGRSMGAQQALQWGCLYPHMVDSIFALCGVPRTTPHNRLLLESMADALQAGGPGALRQAARIYGGWCFSQEFFASCLPGGTSAVEWIDRQLGPAFDAFDAGDLLALVRTWQSADISDNPLYRGDLAAALQSVRARTLLMPISHDLIFPPQDVEAAQAWIRNADTSMLYSAWGHRAAAPGGAAEDVVQLERALRRFLGVQRPVTAAACWDHASRFLSRGLRRWRVPRGGE